MAKKININDYQKGFDAGFQDGRADGYAEGYETAERELTERLKKFTIELLELNARVDVLMRKIG